MHEHNEMPMNSKIVYEYNDLRSFFSFKFQGVEYRQILMGGSALSNSFDLRIFWIDKKRGLGFGIADNWLDDRIDWYSIGLDEEWLKFKTEFAARFKGDNT